MEDALDRFTAWESRTPLNRAVGWYVLGMTIGLAMEWSEGWNSIEQIFETMILGGLICASISLLVSFTKWIFAAATLRLLDPKA